MGIKVRVGYRKYIEIAKEALELLKKVKGLEEKYWK